MKKRESCIAHEKPNGEGLECVGSTVPVVGPTTRYFSPSLNVPIEVQLDTSASLP
jgi:hypothetical protein